MTSGVFQISITEDEGSKHDDRWAVSIQESHGWFTSFWSTSFSGACDEAGRVISRNMQEAKDV